MPTRKYSSKLEHLDQICDFASDCAREAGLDERQVYAVLLAVNEAATNIIEHGYRGAMDGDLSITCKQVPEGLRVTLHDHAPPFDPEDVPTPVVDIPLEQLKPRGLGVYLIRKMMDSVQYQFDAVKGNTLTMLKKR